MILILKGGIMESKTIKLKKETYNRLIKLGKPYPFNDTIDTLVNRVLDKLDKVNSNPSNSYTPSKHNKHKK